MKPVREFSQSVGTWRCRGATFYSVCISVAAFITWGVLAAPFYTGRNNLSRFPFLGFRSLLVLCSIQPLVIAANARAVTACDGFALPSLLRLAPRSFGPVTIPLARCFWRFRSLKAAKQSLLLIAAYLFAGGCFTLLCSVERLDTGSVKSGEQTFAIAGSAD